MHMHMFISNVLCPASSLWGSMPGGNMHQNLNHIFVEALKYVIINFSVTLKLLDKSPWIVLFSVINDTIVTRSIH